MSQDEFQKLVLEGISELKKDMSYLKDKLRVIEEQTKGLTEFKQAVKESANDLIKKIS